ncbi:Signal peptidase complex catalytic subunit [Datura stramonium]|uniref:Signal peptidase complex catalytic subunit n=1 Tax=Datura stramonium TaxID=4076 RepID=A0ABS8WMQ4_DATST|nr:Signal peptidase complex catalytic subunit [Datura stramonium]
MRDTDFLNPSSDVISRFKIPIELQSLEFTLLKPVNGILCICGPLLSHVSYVYLWNPITGEFKALPKPIVQMGYVAVGFGFGFVPSTYDYKVVRLIKHERKSDSTGVAKSLEMRKIRLFGRVGVIPARIDFALVILLLIWRKKCLLRGIIKGRIVEQSLGAMKQMLYC